MKELIKECPLSNHNILVFDSGLQARATFREFNNENLIFVTRLNNYTLFETKNELKIVQKETERLLL